ncbi:MAG: carboxypeptidase-like regulatory domain-containing protein, partial [Pirellulaceae bacterium]|nr:carboxypeptidase-like regulatory domain-containing protein [Pirellulaceae bacterium]
VTEQPEQPEAIPRSIQESQEPTDKPADDTSLEQPADESPANPVSETEAPQATQESEATETDQVTGTNVKGAQETGGLTTGGLATDSKSEEDAKDPDARMITGQVVDSQGKGVPNATLFCLNWNTATTGKTDRRTLTDQNGNFALPYPSKPPYFDHLYTWVYAEGFGLRVVGMQKALKSEGNTENVSIPLPPRASTPTRVQVLDSHGAPVAGMLVYPSRVEMPNGPFLANERTGMVSTIPEEILESLAVRTDKDGVATFDHFPDWSWHGFRCRSVEYGEQEFMRAKSSDMIKLQLSPVGSIRGRIAAEDLTRFKNFAFSLTTTSKPDTPENVSGVAIGPINEHGEFHVPAIVAGQLAEFQVFSLSSDIQLVCDNYRSQKVLPKASLELELTAPPTVTVSGVVLTSDTRQPVSGALISYSRPGSPHDRVCKTNDKGEFNIKVVPGKINFQMFSIGDQFGRSGRYGHARKFPDQIKEATQLEVLLPANKQVKGKLQDAAGRPIANQKVARHIGGPFMHLDGLATTDAQGNFAMFLDIWPISAGGYWAIVDKVENDKPELTVVNQMSNTGDFFVLERPTVPVQPPKDSFSR